MDSSSILLTGATGQVGSQLLRTLAKLGTIVAPSRTEMDLSQPDAVRKVIRNVKPRWIVNPGAYTAVDRAESEPELAFAVNAATVGAIGEEAQRLGAGVIHFSTDYVFSGSGTEPHKEGDAPDPVSVYGASKLAGEQALMASGAAHLIFRTSWVYGATGKNFLLTIVKLAREREEIRIVADQHGAPTWSGDLAMMTAAVIMRCEASVAEEQPIADAVTPLNGVYHAAGAGETTWYGLASEAINRVREREPGVRFAKLLAISTAAYPTPAKRPENSRLDCSKLLHTFGWALPEWRQSLRTVIGDLTLYR